MRMKGCRKIGVNVPRRIRQTHLHLGLSFAASGLKLLLVMMCFYFNLLGGQVCSYMLRVQVGAGS